MLDKENKSQRLSPVVKESHLDFLYDLYSKGIDLSPENIHLLKLHEYIKEEELPPQEKKETVKPDNINRAIINKSTDKQREHDANIDFLFDDGENEKEETPILSDQELEERRRKGRYIFEGRDTPIRKKDWMPKSTIEHEPDFIEFVTSINTLGFQQRTNYRKLNLYVQQCYTWLAERTNYTDFVSEAERQEYKMQELLRCDENGLYFLNKYVYYQEGDDKSGSGKTKYTGLPVHEVMAYMDDCGYSQGIAKGRQIAATTTQMALDVRDMIFKVNHFMKFITEDQDKAEEIFEDKLKYCFSELPFWMKPNVLNERDNYFKLGNKEQKGDKGGVNSRIRVVPPKRTAIAGGAPQKVKIDEAGNVNILTVMINNARPTMFKYNPVTKLLEMVRKLVFWGTGGEMERGGMAFQTEFLALLKQWAEGNFKSGIVPLFFDCTCRPGFTEQLYQDEKSIAYSKVGPDLKRSIIEFHQTWPRTISDVFMSSDKTLVDIQYIDEQIARIREAKRVNSFQLHQKGYFEPIYDETVPMDENSDTPFKIIGATFVPTGDIDERATVTIFTHPHKDWIWRYYQGTDPIATDTGLSNMAGAIWDKYHNTVAAIVDTRSKDYRQTFLQTMLLSIYYNANNSVYAVKELLESNIGQSYSQYKASKGFDDTMTLNYELPPYLQNKTTINEGVGIDNRGLRNGAIINKLHELIQAYGPRIYHEVFFEQLKTFVCDVSDGGKEMWGPSNKKYFKDDVLFAVTFSYICAHLCGYPEPQNTGKESQKTMVIYETVYDENFNLIRRARKVRANAA